LVRHTHTHRYSAEQPERKLELHRVRGIQKGNIKVKYVVGFINGVDQFRHWSYIWSIALYGTETWTLRAVDQKHLEILKCGAGEGWKRSVGLIM
jgi:hypothetical protein